MQASRKDSPLPKFHVLKCCALALTTLAALGQSAHPAVAQNLVQDGSFESPTSPPDTVFYAGDAFGADNVWHVASGSIDLINGRWQVPDGVQTVDMNGYEDGSIYQDLATSAGTAYLLTFSMAGNPEGPAELKTLGVSAGGVSLGSPSFDTAGRSNSDMGWTQEAFSFTAAGSTTRLQFTSLDASNNYYGPTLDEISVTAAPEPSQYAGLGLGALGMGGFAFKACRRKCVTA